MNHQNDTERAAFEAPNLPQVVAAHADDLERCLPALREFGLNATAAQFAKSVAELRAALAVVPAEPVHPNHRPDLRYVLMVLEKWHNARATDDEIAAAITGMRYIIARTEESASPAAAVEAPTEQWLKEAEELIVMYAQAVEASVSDGQPPGVMKRRLAAVTALLSHLRLRPEAQAVVPTNQEMELGVCSLSRATIGDRTHDRRPQESNRGAGEEKQRGTETGRCDAARPSGAELGACSGNAAQHAVTEDGGAGNGAARPTVEAGAQAVAPKDEPLCFVSSKQLPQLATRSRLYLPYSLHQVGNFDTPLYTRPAVQEQPEAHARMIHDFPALALFHEKYALGPMREPSCLCCGQSMQGREVGVQHMELPGIVICKKCHDAAVAVQEEVTSGVQTEGGSNAAQ